MRSALRRLSRTLARRPARCSKTRSTLTSRQHFRALAVAAPLSSAARRSCPTSSSISPSRLCKRLIDNDDTGTLRASIGTDYQVKPDVTVGLDSGSGPPFLHAAVPCKWTLRSDRAQNVRHEAVVLIRHRRGRLPHITPVTAEPMPTRLASLARGTAEVDALYHVALDELSHGVRASGAREQIAVLDELVGHDRLKDLSELTAVLEL